MAILLRLMSLTSCVFYSVPKHGEACLFFRCPYTSQLSLNLNLDGELVGPLADRYAPLSPWISAGSLSSYFQLAAPFRRLGGGAGGRGNRLIRGILGQVAVPK